MNYIINMILAFTSFLLTCSSCESPLIEYTIELNEKRLINTFYAKENINLKIDWKSFSYSCFNKEKSNFIDAFDKSINKIHNHLSFNQVLIEDQNGDMRFYSDELLIEGEYKDIELINCNQSWIESVKIENKKKVNKTKRIKYKSDLMVTRNSKQIRIYILFKNETMLKSNWLKISPDS